MSTAILLRHGRSTWNDENLFTGWYDSPLSEPGKSEAEASGRLLLDEGILPDIVHTSVLARAIATAEIALRAAGRMWVPVHRHWRLNERHYGGLQGLNKAAVREQYGAEQLQLWRRSYDTPPPPVDPGSEHHPANDPRYELVPPDQLPPTECLKDVVERMLPYWHDRIVPDLRAGLVVLVAAHGNSLRALVKHLKGISDAEIAELEIPTGVPWVFELDDRDPCRPIKEWQLGDPQDIERRAEEVKRQAERRTPG